MCTITIWTRSYSLTNENRWASFEIKLQTMYNITLCVLSLIAPSAPPHLPPPPSDFLLWLDDAFVVVHDFSRNVRERALPQPKVPLRRCYQQLRPLHARHWLQDELRDADWKGEYYYCAEKHTKAHVAGYTYLRRWLWKTTTVGNADWTGGGKREKKKGNKAVKVVFPGV